MKNGKNEFLGLLCNLYMVFLLAVLPLYTGEGYWQLGDAKYMLFRNVSVLCLGVWLAAGIPGGIRKIAEWVYGRSGGRSEGAPALFCRVDCAVAAYGVFVLLSAFGSRYGKLAWSGYEGWYMGTFSQLLFVGIYFFVSRQYDGSRWPLYLGEAALFLATMFGLLHRLGIDPLGLLTGWNSGDWEYSHMLSTLGNINWLCGYYSVALAFAVVPYLREERRWVLILRYLAAVSAFVLLGVQGSQGGLLILAVCVVVCVILCRRRIGALKRLCLLLTGFFLGMPLMGLLMELRGDKAAVVRDGNIFGDTRWYGWMIAALAGLILFFFLRKRGKCQAGNVEAGREIRSERYVPIFVGSGIILVLVLVCGVLPGVVDDSFGSGRGLLWRIAQESFWEADGKDRLLGVGADCYGEAVFNRLGADSEVWKGEHWEYAVFTNAHNEVLSQLCNVGILGTAAYLAIFLTGLHRYWSCRSRGRRRPERQASERGEASENGNVPEGEELVPVEKEAFEEEAPAEREETEGEEEAPAEREESEGEEEASAKREESEGEEEAPGKAGESEGKKNFPEEGLYWFGVLVLAMYGAHSLISFQQVLNAPLLFLALGLCEAGIRSQILSGNILKPCRYRAGFPEDTVPDADRSRTDPVEPENDGE